MKKLIAPLAAMSLVAALAIATSSASGSGEGASAARSGTVLLTDDNLFESGTLKVREFRRVAIDRRDKITFVWDGSSSHNVKGIKGNKFGPTEITDEDGHTEAKRFTRDSVVICQVHRTSMRLKVNVRQDR